MNHPQASVRHRAYVLFAAIPAVLASWALVGWVADISFLKQFVEGRPSLSVMTAICLLVSSAAAISIPRARPLSWALGAIQLLAGFLIVGSHVLRPDGSSWQQHEAWSSLFTGWLFIVAGLAALLLCLGHLAHGQIAAALLLLFSLLIALGHLSTSTRLYQSLPGTGVAIPTAASFMSLALSMLLACPHQGIMSALSTTKLAGPSGRRLLVGGMAVVAAATGLLLWAVVVERLDPASALLLLGWTALGTLALTMWTLAIAVDRAESTTRRVEKEHAIQQSMVTAAVSHDLRSPLQTASVAVRLLRAYMTDPRTARPIDQLERSHRRLDRLLRSMLDNFSVAAGRSIRLNPSLFGLQDLILEVVAENAGTLESRVSVSGDAQGFWDREALFRVVENLLMNARKYGSADAPIRCLVLSEGEDHVRLQVENSGKAIAPEEWESIFGAFSRSESAGAFGVEGWGVGLAFSRLVAKEHGGTLRVASSDVDRTVFELTLPRMPPAAIGTQF
jgi:signal transduction histidine kinase